MRSIVFASALLVAGCEQPDPAPQDGEPQPRGEQVIDGAIWQLYQDGDRVEQVPDLRDSPMIWTRTIFVAAVTSPSVRWRTSGSGPLGSIRPTTTTDDVTDCTAADNVGRIHLPEFEHSPFACGLICCGCCAPEISDLNYVYTSAVENLHGNSLPDESGEPYIAIDPDRPCDP